MSAVRFIRSAEELSAVYALRLTLVRFQVVVVEIRYCSGARRFKRAENRIAELLEKRPPTGGAFVSGQKKKKKKRRSKRFRCLPADEPHVIYTHTTKYMYYIIIFRIPKTKAAGQPVVVNHARGGVGPTQLIVRHYHYIIIVV